MDIKLEILKRGLFKHNRKPGLITEYSLFNYLKFCNNRNRLIQEIAYCLTTPIELRLNRELWQIAFNSSPINDWQYKVVYPYKKNYTTLKDLIIIDISSLNNYLLKKEIFNTYSWFKNELIQELKIINQHGQQL